MDDALEIFDGVMLGDGSLVRSNAKAYFAMNLSKTSKDGRLTMGDNFTWLECIKSECLIPLGVNVFDKYPKPALLRDAKGRTYSAAVFRSRSSSFLKRQHDRWYKQTGESVNYRGLYQYRRGDTKRLPLDLILTPTVLAHWFIGDGGSTRRGLTKNVTVTLAVCGFEVGEVLRLTSMLNGMGITTVKPNVDKNAKKGSGLVIYLAQRSVDDFFGIIAPYMPSHRGLLQYKRGEHY